MGDSLDSLVEELKSIDEKKESQQLRKTIFKRHGVEMLGKREEP